jgi:RNA polymerase sigma-70 factor (ECF subfamily)
LTTDPPPLAPTDAELLRRSAKSSAAFRLFYDRHVARLHGFMLRRTSDPRSAFELTAETFAEAWLSRGRFVDRGEGAAPWLFGIARNVIAASVRDRRVRRQARQRLGLEAAADVAAPDDGWLDGLDEALRDAVDELPDSQREAVQMRVLDDAGYPAIAATLGISEGAARVRVHRGLTGLRARLSTSRPGSASVAVPAVTDRQENR